jgi:heme/copper-type cytochrome/quinol oxidase subunit 2
MAQQPAVNPYAAPKARVDDNLGNEAPELWGPEAGGAWSLLLSVAFGSWVMLQNWHALDEPERAANSRIWLILSIVVFVLVLAIPGAGLIGLPYMIVWYFVENRPQIKYIKERYGKDYPHRPWTKVVLLTLVMVLCAGFLIGLISAVMFRR